MRIDRILTEARQAELAQRLREQSGRTDPAAPAEPISPVARVDRVEISDAGRAMAAQDEEGGAAGELSAERLAELRERVRTGAYNDPAVAAEVARRLLGSGDL